MSELIVRRTLGLFLDKIKGLMNLILLRDTICSPLLCRFCFRSLPPSVAFPASVCPLLTSPPHLSSLCHLSVSNTFFIRYLLSSSSFTAHFICDLSLSLSTVWPCSKGSCQNLYSSTAVIPVALQRAILTRAQGTEGTGKCLSPSFCVLQNCLLLRWTQNLRECKTASHFKSITVSFLSFRSITSIKSRPPAWPFLLLLMNACVFKGITRKN